MARAVYIGIAPGTGRIVAAEDSAKDVAATMRKMGFDRFWYEDDGSVKDLEARQNPANLAVPKVIKLAGLRPIPYAEANMKVQEAWDRIYPRFFSPLRRGGAPIASMRTPAGLGDSLLAPNAKLAKGASVQASPVSFTLDADFVGLNLTPANKLHSREEGPLAGYPSWFPNGVATPLIDPIVKETRMRTFCLGSNYFCQASCLVFTGSNASDPYNDDVKAMKSLALLADPAAFLRLIDDKIDRAKRAAAKRNQRLLVRLNLLSDLPWEAIAPWLFEKHADVQFYDYTKIPTRNPPKNYDLTLSFSGTNEQECRRALYDHNQRIAVVFLAMQYRNGEWVAVGEGTRRKMGERSLPDRFDVWGDPRLVVNADVNDARFLDPPNEMDGTACVAGLTWKTPKGQSVKVDEKFGFVTPAYVLEGQDRPVLVAPVTPRSQGADVGGA